MERMDWIKIREKYRKHRAEETFASDFERENDTMILLAEICEEIWKLRNNQP